MADSEPTDPTSPEALNDFLDGIEERLGGNFEVDVISSVSDRRAVKREIASELGVEEAYHPNMMEAVGEHGDEGIGAHEAVEERYEELLQTGAIREDPTWEDPIQEWSRQICRHYKGEEDLTAVDNTV